MGIGTSLIIAQQVHPCRNCLDKVFHFGSTGPKVAASGDDDNVEDIDHAGAEMSPLKHTLLSWVIIASTFTIAYLVDDLQMGEWRMARGCLDLPILTFVL